MKIRPVIRNAFFNSGAWALSVLLSVAFTPYVVRQLTIEGYGIYALFTSLIGYYALLDLGLGQSLIKFIPHYKATGDYAGMNRSINTAFSIQIIAGLISSGLLIAFADPILGWLAIPPASRPGAKAAWLACAVGFFFSMLSGTVNSLLMGFQRYDVTGKLGVARDLSINLALVTVLFLGGRLKAAIDATVCLTVAIFVAYLIKARQTVPQWRFSFAFDARAFRHLFGFGIFMFISALSQSFSIYFMRFVLSAMAGPSAVTYYSVPFKVIVAFWGLLSTGGAVLLPFTSQIAAEGDPQRLPGVYLNAAKYSMILSVPVFSLLAIFGRPILAVWMGGAFAEKAWPTLCLLSLGSLLNSTAIIPVAMAFGLGRSRLVALFSLLTMCVAAGLGIPLIRLKGVTGAALGVSVASSVWVLFSFYFAKRLLGVVPRQHFNRVYRFHVLAALPFLAALAFFERLWSGGSLIQLTVWLPLAVGVYCALLLLTKWLATGEVKRLWGARARG